MQPRQPTCLRQSQRRTGEYSEDQQKQPTVDIQLTADGGANQLRPVRAALTIHSFALRVFVIHYYYENRGNSGPLFLVLCLEQCLASNK